MFSYERGTPLQVLPPYTLAAILKEKLLLAVREGREGFQLH